MALSQKGFLDFVHLFSLVSSQAVYEWRVVYPIFLDLQRKVLGMRVKSVKGDHFPFYSQTLKLILVWWQPNVEELRWNPMPTTRATGWPSALWNSHLLIMTCIKYSVCIASSSLLYVQWAHALWIQTVDMMGFKQTWKITPMEQL